MNGRSTPLIDFGGGGQEQLAGVAIAGAAAHLNQFVRAHPQFGGVERVAGMAQGQGEHRHFPNVAAMVCATSLQVLPAFKCSHDLASVPSAARISLPLMFFALSQARNSTSVVGQ